MGIGYSGMSISVSLIPQILIDSAAAGGLHSAGRGLAVYAGLFVLTSLLAVLSQYAYRRTALRAAAALRLRIMEKKTRLPMSFLETSHSGELLSRMLYDMNRVEELYRTKLKEFVNPILALITSVIPMLLLNVPLTLLLLAVSALCLFVNTTFSGRIRQRRGSVRDTQTVLGHTAHRPDSIIRTAAGFRKGFIDINLTRSARFL